MSDGISQMLLEQEIEQRRKNLKKALEKLIPFGATYQVNYHDYEENQWTASVSLNEKRISDLVNDYSITKIRIELEG